MTSELRSERLGNTLVLTISDMGAPHDASELMFAAGVEALNVAESDPAVRCVILQGGDRQFFASEDGTNTATDTSTRAQLLERCKQFIECVRAYPKPIIAAVEGLAAGIGFALVLACDLVVAADDARFIASRSTLDLSIQSGTDGRGAQILTRPLVLQSLWLAESISAHQLHAVGLVNWLSKNGHALTEARSVANRLARCSPHTLAGLKERLA